MATPQTTPLDPTTLKNNAEGINKTAENSTNALVGNISPTANAQFGANQGGLNVQERKALRNQVGVQSPGTGSLDSSVPNAVGGNTPGQSTSTPSMGTAPVGNTSAPSVGNAPGVSGTAPVKSYDQQRNDAYAEFQKEAGLTPENQKSLDMARQELANVGSGETFEQAYNRMRNEQGYKDVQDTLLNANSLIRQNREGLENAQNEVFSSDGGVMDTGVQQLRAKNSRDFIANINHLSNIAANSADQLKAMNDNIDTVLKLRQQDRQQQTDNIKARIDMLENTVSPTQLALLKTKLEQKVNSINQQEQAQADLVKQKNLQMLQNGDVNSTDPYIQKQGVLKAINDALAPYTSKGVSLKIPATAHADHIIELMKQGKSFADAFQEDFMTPFKNSDTVKAIDAQNTGNDWKVTTYTDPNSGATVPMFYRTNGGKIEYQDRFGNPMNMDSPTTGLMSLAGQTDLRGLADKYPTTAAFKNNNPSGITWQSASEGLKQAWKDAGIQFDIGTARPTNEGGNYVSFASAEDGIKAKMIAITRGYGNATVNSYLDKWGTGSGNIKTSFDKNKKISDLSESEFNELVTKQMAWESPNFLKEYEKSKETDKTPKIEGIKSGDDVLSIQISSKANDMQKNALAYASRMVNANNDLKSLEDKFGKMSYLGQEWESNVPNWLKSDNQQIMESRKKEFITAVLRQESGASISEGEFANEEKKYFPQPGDSTETIIEKQQAREFAIKTMLSKAGKDIKGNNISDMYQPSKQSNLDDKKVTQENSGAGITLSNGKGIDHYFSKQ